MHEETFIEKLYAKDQETFVNVMDSYNKFLWAVVGSILHNTGTVEDIEECISDVYVKLWENPKAYDPKKGSLKTFLAVIGKNKALDRYRRLTKNKTIELDEAVHTKDDDLTAYVINKERCQSLYTAIRCLKEPDREILIRRYFFEEKPSTIAQQISIPVKEVENRLYQGKNKIKKSLADKEVLQHE